jgi:hypothetical protein
MSSPFPPPFLDLTAFDIPNSNTINVMQLDVGLLFSDHIIGGTHSKVTVVRGF